MPESFLHASKHVLEHVSQHQTRGVRAHGQGVAPHGFSRISNSLALEAS